MSDESESLLMHRRGLLLGGGATVLCCALESGPSGAADGWRKDTAFGVELEIPAGWKRREFHVKPDDHEEVMFAEKTPDIFTGAWFSVFPGNEELLDPDRAEQPTVVDGRPARMTDFLTRAEDPPPRRRQIIIYFTDSQMPAFLFDGDSTQWTTLGPLLARIVASIRLPKR